MRVCAAAIFVVLAASCPAAAGSANVLAGTETTGTRAILPAEDRAVVTDTTIPPYRAVGLVLAEGPDGSFGQCTGVLVGARTVLTSAACLYDHEAGGWKESVLFAPGVASAENAPFGVWDYEELLLPAGYIENYEGHFGSVLQWSLGLIVLGEPIGEHLGWPALGPAGGAGGADVRTIGYYWDKPLAEMWEEECSLVPHDTVPDLSLLSGCWGSTGAIGAPVLGRDDAATAVVGVQAAQSPQSGIFVLELGGPLGAWVRASLR